MYPTLYHAFYDLFGAEFPALKLVNSFGFFVALAFVVAARLLAVEMRRKEREGWFRGPEVLIEPGRLARPGGREDLVLTRILTLDGLERANANSLARFIYIHGTNQEKLIGKPASHGCVRLRNADMAALHNMVRAGTSVRIIPPRPPRAVRT
jgi:hypothetical protein